MFLHIKGSCLFPLQIQPTLASSCRWNQNPFETYVRQVGSFSRKFRGKISEKKITETIHVASNAKKNSQDGCTREISWKGLSRDPEALKKLFHNPGGGCYYWHSGRGFPFFLKKNIHIKASWGQGPN